MDITDKSFEENEEFERKYQDNNKMFQNRMYNNRGINRGYNGYNRGMEDGNIELENKEPKLESGEKENKDHIQGDKDYKKVVEEHKVGMECNLDHPEGYKKEEKEIGTESVDLQKELQQVQLVTKKQGEYHDKEPKNHPYGNEWSKDQKSKKCLEGYEKRCHRGQGCQKCYDSCLPCPLIIDRDSYRRSKRRIDSRFNRYRFKEEEGKKSFGKTILKCKDNGALALPAATKAGVHFTVAALTVDTSKMRKPYGNIQFSTNISTTSASLHLQFQVYKQCKDLLAPIPIGPVFTFSTKGTITHGNTFSFMVCDCDSCNGKCCTYTVVVTVAAVPTVGLTNLGNNTLSAFIVDDSWDF
ncbi:MAG TPA: DUF4489 domain-containing protein [Candidatus Merdenecus merdavium]|nr:DUF4489 domain-containing protein [Candidatus Merdenecus merdavium]